MAKEQLTKLTVKIVVEFAIAVAKKNLWEKKAAALRDRILPLLQRGDRCPLAPFILKYSEPERPSWSWKDEYIRLLAKTRYGNTKASSIRKATELAERKQSATLVPCPTVNVEVNPKWKGDKVTVVAD